MGILDMDDIEDRLPLIDQRVADMIRQTDDPAALRLFACECAALALGRCDSPDPRCMHAVDVGRRFACGKATAKELEDARRDAERAALSIERHSDELELAFKSGKVSKAEHITSCYQVYGAMCAYDCTTPSAKMAAAMASYEASQAHAGDLYEDSKLERAEHQDVMAALARRVLGSTTDSTCE